ncbi:NAD(P)-dependent oxidoreductase [Bradyrhizobium sp.]|uniref:NAD-dependent epimerase/dehydratase family protein n=1 Tax=Bradyrhizobium sp. TaxID=376 RepID=UPI0026051222|nr:NAD(P)-dependent oxidoreductase [Bradyrhizobium sp.]
MSTFLVTGAKGFIGRALARRLECTGDSVIGLSTADGDIADQATLKPYRSSEIRHVFHLAGRSFVPQSWNDPIEFHRVNTMGTLNVLEFCRERRIPLTYVSAYLYGQPMQQPIREDHPVVPNNPYGLSKVQAEMACEFYARTHGLHVSIVRPFNVYGFGQDENFLIPTILRQVLSAGEIEVQDLAPKRDYLYMDDLVELLLATPNAPSGYNVYNGGTGTSLSVAEVIALAQAEAATSKPVRCGQSVRIHEIDDTRADIEKARNELGWSPKHEFRDGVRAIIARMREVK